MDSHLLTEILLEISAEQLHFDKVVIGRALRSGALSNFIHEDATSSVANKSYKAGHKYHVFMQYKSLHL